MWTMAMSIVKIHDNYHDDRFLRLSFCVSDARRGEDAVARKTLLMVPGVKP